MKKFIASAVFCFVMSVAAFAQSPAVVLEKLKQVKFFESTREDVKRIFEGYQENPYRLDVSHFPMKNMSFSVYYSSGDCADENEDWNTPVGKVTYIIFFLNKPVAPEELGVDLSPLRKERMFLDSSEDFIYHDKNTGVNYDVCKGKIYSIDLFPPKENLPFLCANKTERRKFYERKNWEVKKSNKPILRQFANVNEVTLSTNEITVSCSAVDSADGRNCTDDAQLIEVQVEADASPCSSWDFTYNYTISAGRIIGQGEKIVWDLSGVKPGKYTITAGVDNGCGVCGTTKTETVTVKKCDDCGQK